MKISFAAASLMTLLIVAQPVFAQTAKKKKPTIGTLGTAQMPGGSASFGQTYTFANSGGYEYNVSIVSAEYSDVRHNINTGTTLAPKVGEKLLILHLRAQNPAKGDMYFSGNFLSFSTIAADGKTRDHNDYLRLASAKEQVDQKLKPGQKFPDEVLMGCIVPAEGPISKLILNMGRMGTKDQVTRYFLGVGPNIVKKLPALYADPADPSGTTALKVIPATIGTTYAPGYFNMAVTNVAFVPGPIGEEKAPDGKRFLVVTMAVTNKTWHPTSFDGGYILATLKTADDEKTTDFVTLKGKRDERWEGRKLDPDETVNVRLLFVVPNDTTGTTLNIAESLDNSGGISKAFSYDISAIK